MDQRLPFVDIAYISMFAALIAVFAWIAIPVGGLGVPIVLQNAVIIGAGLILGARRATASVALFLLVGLALPILAGGRTTLAALGGPTAGYLVGYLLSAAAAGFIAYRAPAGRPGRQAGWFTLAGVTGLLIQYVCGGVGLMIRTGLTISQAALAQVPFLATDTLKVILMIAVAITVHKAFPVFLFSTRRTPTTQP